MKNTGVSTPPSPLKHTNATWYPFKSLPSDLAHHTLSHLLSDKLLQMQKLTSSRISTASPSQGVPVCHSNYFSLWPTVQALVVASVLVRTLPSLLRPLSANHWLGCIIWQVALLTPALPFMSSLASSCINPATNYTAKSSKIPFPHFTRIRRPYTASVSEIFHLLQNTGYHF